MIPALWETAWHIATESQRAALRDGELTFAEYEAAALTTVQCLNDLGVVGEAVLEPVSNSYSLAARWQSQGPEEDERLRIATDECYVQHWRGVNQAWGAQNTPTEQQIIEARQALAQCMRDEGVEIPDPAAAEDILAHTDSAAYGPCAQRVSQEFGIPYFGG